MLLTAVYYASICSDASALLLCSSIIRQGLLRGLAKNKMCPLPAFPLITFSNQCLVKHFKWLPTIWNTWLGQASQGFFMLWISLCIPLQRISGENTEWNWCNYMYYTVSKVLDHAVVFHVSEQTILILIVCIYMLYTYILVEQVFLNYLFCQYNPTEYFTCQAVDSILVGYCTGISCDREEGVKFSYWLLETMQANQQVYTQF